MLHRKSTFENLTITLQHDIDEQYQYQPGEIIRGKIGILLHRSTVVQSVYISINGEGVCSWDDDYEGTLQSNENYLNATKVIFESVDKPRLFDQGFQDFPFEYKLPENIPSSFIGKYGSITYILKAVVQGEKTGDTLLATEPFLVTRPMEIEESLKEPEVREIAKRFFSMCSWGKVKARVHINKTGFVPGEEMHVEAEVQNKSPVRITAIQASIMMYSKYHAQKNAISHRQMVNKRRDDYELIEGDGRRWQNVRIPIPPYIPESFLGCCDIIDLTYTFQFRLELSGGEELKIELPITIGSLPKGLEVPADYSNNVNIHWTMGPKDLSRAREIDEEGLEDTWKVEAPEFRRENERVDNPLFQSENVQHRNGDKPKLRKSDKNHEFDSIPMESRHHTKL